MFERLVSRYTESENYLDIFLLSIFFTLLSVLLVQHVLPFQVSGQNYAGIIVVLFLSLGMSYPFVRYLLGEEEREISGDIEGTLLQRHAAELKLYLSFFLGATIAFAFSRFFVADSFYSVQCSVLKVLGRAITDNCEILIDQSALGATGVSFTGLATGGPSFLMIFTNNLWVYIATFLLAFFLSSGLLFILAWNASVLGVWVGTVSASVLNSAAFVPAIVLLYLPHGIPEIAAYIFAGFAGSLLSRESEALFFHESGARDTSTVVLRDVVTMVVIGFGLLILGAFIEVL